MRYRLPLAWLALSLAGCLIDGTGEGVDDASGTGPSTGSFGAGGGGQNQGGAATTTTTTTSTSSTTTTGGVGGAGLCGDSALNQGELCDSGTNGDDTDGCDDNCMPTLAHDCPAPHQIAVMPSGGQFTVLGDTTGAADGFNLDPNFPCKADGEEGWVGVRFAAAGTVTTTLTVLTGFGGNMDKAELHLRRGCPSEGMAEQELICNKTPQGGVTNLQFFARAGEIYYFVVDADGGNDKGTFELLINQSSVCGDLIVQGIEQCDPGPTPTPACQGCMHTDNSCGAPLTGLYNAPRKRCFTYSDAGLPFADARKTCVQRGGDLASLQAATAIPSAGNDAWVGAADFVDNATDDFSWFNGLVFDGLWEGSNPDINQNQQRCVMRKGGQTNYDDKPCTETHAYLCELWLGNP